MAAWEGSNGRGGRAVVKHLAGYNYNTRTVHCVRETKWETFCQLYNGQSLGFVLEVLDLQSPKKGWR